MRLSRSNNSKMRDAMNKDNAKDRDSASALNDPLTDLLKTGARALIQQAVEAELQPFLGKYAKVTDLRGGKPWCVIVICRSGRS